MKRSERPSTLDCLHEWVPVASSQSIFRCTLCGAGGHRGGCAPPMPSRRSRPRPGVVLLYKCRSRHREVYCNRPAYCSQGRCDLHEPLRPGEEE